VSDHPVTLYNASIPPTNSSCTYPDDPSIEYIGTQTVFVLDANTCLILTHLEYANSPAAAQMLVSRTNARYRGSALVRTDSFIRTRQLTVDEVVVINYLLKSRAKRFVAASVAESLFPEKSFSGVWSDIAQVLLPKDELWKFGGEIYVGYGDGKTSYQDAFGRTSGAHEYLRRSNVKADQRSNDACGCGSGRKFKRCCEDLLFEDRPTWEFYSIRERNLMFCHTVEDILGLNAGKSWLDVQREISDDQVKRIYEAFGSLWPEDTDLPSLLPRPNKGILRGVYLGISDPRLISAAILGWLPYFDEIVLAHPFVNPLRIRPEYSPTLSPSQYKEQTLKNVLFLLMLEPFIYAGYIHIIPDPGDFDAQFGEAVHQMAQERAAKWVRPIKGLTGLQKAIAEDDARRAAFRRPEAFLRRLAREQMPEASNEQVDSVLAYAKSQLETDPYALLQPIELGKTGAQLHSIKGFALETGMFLASLTGSFVFTDIEIHWQQLHLHALAPGQDTNTDWTLVTEALRHLALTIELDGQPLLEALRRGRFKWPKRALGSVVEAIPQQPRPPVPKTAAMHILCADESIREAWTKVPIGNRLTGHVELSIPESGFDRIEVRRLLLTFGRVKIARPVTMAILIKFDDV
jgi:hypothetical protein